MKKLFLIAVPTVVFVGSLVSGVSADTHIVGSGSTEHPQRMSCDPVTWSGSTPVFSGAPKCLIAQKREVNKKKTQEMREANKKMQEVAKEKLTEFHTNNSGALHDMRKSNTGATREAIKMAHSGVLDMRAKMQSGSLQDKKALLPEMERARQVQIEARFANATGALKDDRMKLYEENKEKRATIIDEKIQAQLDRIEVTTASIAQASIALDARLPKMTAEQKSEAAKYIQARIDKLTANKNLSADQKASLIAGLTAMKAKLQ